MSHPAKPTNGLIEILRILAILGVVWFHIKELPYRPVAYTGLIIFVIITTVLSVVSVNKSTFLEFLTKKAWRLLMPWAFWFLILMAANRVTGRPLLNYSHDIISTILVGPWIGLWYLPFAFAISIFSFCFQRGTSHLSDRVVCYSALLVSLLLLFSAEYFQQNYQLISPWAQWLHASPGISFGFAISTLMREKKSGWEAAIICACPFLYAIVSQCSNLNLDLVYMIGVPATTLAFMFPKTVPSVVTFAASLCMGVYVLHGGLISVIDRGVPHLSSPYGRFLLVVILSFGMAALIKRIPFVRKTI